MSVANLTVPDAVSIAAQTGRLDFVSAVLASLGLVIALGTLPFLFYLRGRAGTVAKEAAEARMKELETELERRAIERMEKMLPGLVEDYTKLARASAHTEQGNEIAGTVGEEEK